MSPNIRGLLKVRARSASFSPVAPGPAPDDRHIVATRQTSQDPGAARGPSHVPPASSAVPPGMVGALQDVSATMVVEEQSTGSSSDRGEAGRDASAAEAAAIARAVSVEIARLAATTAKGLNRWPGVVLTSLGVALLVATYVTEWAAATKFGVAEYVASLAVGLCLTVVGGGLISLDLSRGNILRNAAEAAKEWDAAHSAEITGGSTDVGKGST